MTAPTITPTDQADQVEELDVVDGAAVLADAMRGLMLDLLAGVDTGEDHAAYLAGAMSAAGYTIVRRAPMAGPYREELAAVLASGFRQAMAEHALRVAGRARVLGQPVTLEASASPEELAPFVVAVLAARPDLLRAILGEQA